MINPGPPQILSRLGQALASKPRSYQFALCFVGLVLFLVASAPIVGTTSRFAAKKLGIAPVAARSALLETDTNADFADRLSTASGLAYNAFFNLGLSKVNFISNFTELHPINGSRFEYTYLELWVTNDFSFSGARDLFNQLVVERIRGVTLEPTQVDAKTYRLTFKIDGLETHKFIFSKTGVEAESDARALAVTDLLQDVPQVKFAGPARLAIIIDDIGYRQEIERQFLDLPAKLTFAILPFSPQGPLFAREARDRGHEILLHIPMEPKAYPEITPGRGGLLMNMSKQEILDTLEMDLAQVPYISGVNNHMGSAFTSDVKKMNIVLTRIGREGLYYIDSRTAGSAKGFETARALGVPTAMRNVFLDHDPRPAQIAKQFDLMVQYALQQGQAIAIGHPHLATLEVLRAKLPELRNKNIVVVAPSLLVQ